MLFGIGTSSMAANIMVWLEQYTKITSFGMAGMSTMVSVALMVTPVIMGTVLDDTPMALCYLQTAAIVAIAFLLLLVKFHIYPRV